LLELVRKKWHKWPLKKQALSTSRIAILDRPIEKNLPGGRVIEVPAGMKII
jgi:hypothetical protein